MASLNNISGMHLGSRRTSGDVSMVYVKSPDGHELADHGRPII